MPPPTPPQPNQSRDWTELNLISKTAVTFTPYINTSMQDSYHFQHKTDDERLALMLSDNTKLDEHNFYSLQSNKAESCSPLATRDSVRLLNTVGAASVGCVHCLLGQCCSYTTTIKSSSLTNTLLLIISRLWCHFCLLLPATPFKQTSIESRLHR